jgi:hypothetical protein
MKQCKSLSILTLVLALSLAAAAQADIVCVPDALTLNTTTPTGDVVVDYTGGGSANVVGYSLDIQWDHTLATAVFARPDNGAFNGAVMFQVVNLGDGHVQVDAAIGGADPGIASGELCKISFTAVGGVQGTGTIDLTIADLRDLLNADVTGVVAVDGSISVDTGAPVVTDVAIVNDTLAHTDDYVKDTDAVTITATVSDDDPGFGAGDITADLSALGGAADAAPDSYVGTTATWTVAAAVCTPADGALTVTVTATDAGANEGQGSDTIVADNTAPTPLLGLAVTPGHEQIHLAWTDFSGNDANPLGVEFRYAAWGDYPAYDTAAPAYPADETAGDPATTFAGGTGGDWAVAARDIYYVAGFVYDQVLHYSAAGVENTGRATNYWLGDVGGASGPDGSVDVVNDINQLANVYGLADTDLDYDPYCDVGPTDTRSPRGIPQPNDDHQIGFEDMMVFALNYSVVTPTTKNARGGTPVLAWRPADDGIWALDLVDCGGDMQGLEIKAALPEGVTCQVAAGDLLALQAAPAFLSNKPGAGLDAGLAVFGRGAGFSGAGELLRVTFSEPLESVAVSVRARDDDNRDLAVDLSGSAPPPPATTALTGNYPNPFNPRTTFLLEMAREDRVSVVIYGLDGARVRTLVSGTLPAGRHEIVWDGADDRGRASAAGTYFAKVVAGDLRETRKMSLVR